MINIDLGYWVNSFEKFGDFSASRGGGYLSEAAYRDLYRKIVCFEYEPGQVLNEKDLIAELKVGRTPIREALRSLASDGIVELHPSKAVIVRPITLQNTKSLFMAMDLLESSVAKNIFITDLNREISLMERAQTEMKNAVTKRNIFEVLMTNHVFHMAFYHLSRNEYLIYGLKRVRFEAERLGFISFSVEIFQDQPIDELYHILLNDHEDILDCLKRRDFKKLYAVLANHQQTFRNRILEYFSPRNSAEAANF